MILPLPITGVTISSDMKRSPCLPEWLVGFAMVLALLVSSCTRPVEPLRIGVDEWPPYRLIRLAQDKGFFAAEGVDVRLLEFNSLADTRRAFETRYIDGMGATAIEVLVTRDQAARDTRIVRVIDCSEGADMIITGKDVRSMSDLRGKRIGVELATLGMYVLSRALELEGMTLDDIVPVSTSQAAMVSDLSSGRLDAAVTYPPMTTRLLEDPRFHAIFTSAQIPGEVIDVIAFDGTVLRERPEQAAGFLRGLDRAFAYLKENPDDACRIMGEGTNVSPEEFYASLTSGLHLVQADEQKKYFGEDAKLREVLESVARTLKKLDLVTDRPGLTDCLSPQ